MRNAASAVTFVGLAGRWRPPQAAKNASMTLTAIDLLTIVVVYHRETGIAQGSTIQLGVIRDAIEPGFGRASFFPIG